MCKATTKKGLKCKVKPLENSIYCTTHQHLNVINEIKLCTAITSKGVSCQKLSLKNGVLCSIHQDIENYNKELKIHDINVSILSNILTKIYIYHDFTLSSNEIGLIENFFKVFNREVELYDDSFYDIKHTYQVQNIIDILSDCHIDRYLNYSFSTSLINILNQHKYIFMDDISLAKAATQEQEESKYNFSYLINDDLNIYHTTDSSIVNIITYIFRKNNEYYLKINNQSIEYLNKYTLLIKVVLQIIIRFIIV